MPRATKDTAKIASLEHENAILCSELQQARHALNIATNFIIACADGNVLGTFLKSQVIDLCNATMAKTRADTWGEWPR